jgi:hypothetical protein
MLPHQARKRTTYYPKHWALGVMFFTCSIAATSIIFGQICNAQTIFRNSDKKTQRFIHPFKTRGQSIAIDFPLLITLEFQYFNENNIIVLKESRPAARDTLSPYISVQFCWVALNVNHSF